MGKLTIYSSAIHDEQSFARANQAYGFDLAYQRCALTLASADLAQGFDAVCGFVHDSFTQEVLDRLAQLGVRFALLRCAGFDHLDRAAAANAGVGVARVAAYSPNSVAEQAVMLLQALNRKLKLALHRGQRGECVDSYRRYIYIHGTDRRFQPGRLTSQGCITLADKDMIDLFEQVSEHTPVLIALRLTEQR